MGGAPGAKQAESMKFFIDTADVAEITELATTGMLDGVTTNPPVAKTGRFLQVVPKSATWSTAKPAR